ncbi:hypothetical protein MATL_G00256090 [Megalops atlanticus]|uniref:Uncharacterized protein n=1 Tax=Megalops atlanticus TaxID=7932 RepID=A0A9D3T010_MEGAT|nr:hypothetical protein MATL_G00256090 [Megalops atlanticus]
MASRALLVLCVLGIALTLSLAAPAETTGTPSQVPPPELEALFEGTEQPSNPTVRSNEGHLELQQVGRTQATPTRMGRAASTPSKKVPRPCPGCFSVIGDPTSAQTGQ